MDDSEAYFTVDGLADGRGRFIAIERAFDLLDNPTISKQLSFLRFCVSNLLSHTLPLGHEMSRGKDMIGGLRRSTYVKAVIRYMYRRTKKRATRALTVRA